MTGITTARKFTFDVGFVFASSIASLFIGFLLKIILGRFLAASGLGLYSMAFLLYSIISLIGAFGIPTATVKYVAEYKEKDRLHSFVSCSVINSLILGMSAALVLYFLSNIFANFFDMPELTYLIRILAFALPFLVVNNTLLGMLNGLRNMKSYSFSMVFRRVLVLAFTTCLVVIGWGVQGAVFAVAISEIAISILLLFSSRKLFHFTLRGYIQTTKRLISFSSKLFLAGATHMLDTNIDMLMIGYFLTDKDVGIYAIAIAISRLLLMIPGAMNTITYPMISEYHGKTAHNSVEKTIVKSTKYSFLVLSIIGLILILIGKDIISLLLPSEFLAAFLPLVILVFALMFYGSMVSVGATFAGVDRPDIPFKVNSIAVITNFCLNIVLIPILGIIGAAITTSTTYVMRTVIYFALFSRILNVKVNGLWFMRVLGVIGLMIMAFFVFKTWVNPYLLKSILILAYAGFAYKVLLMKEEREEIKMLSRNLLK